MEYLDTTLTFVIVIFVIIFSVRKFNKVDQLEERVDQLEKTIISIQEKDN